MSRSLDVYLFSKLAGRLDLDQSRNITFVYAGDWLDCSAGIPLSQSLPLRKAPFGHEDCRGYFAGLLPSGDARTRAATNMGVGPRNDLVLLDKLGGECTGAVSFLPSGSVPDQNKAIYRRMSSQQLARILNLLPQRPLLAGEEGIRHTLPGHRPKAPVHKVNSQITMPFGGSPSTHIIKPADVMHADYAANELLCLRIAAILGVPVVAAEEGKAEEISYLLTERYDRRILNVDGAGTSSLVRLHQEDFCQALGCAPDRSSQSLGGPSLRNCFDLVRCVSSSPAIDLISLLDAVILNFLIGNTEADGRSYSLLYGNGDHDRNYVRLAPFYGIRSGLYYAETSPRHAMKIGNQYLSSKVTAKDFEILAAEAGLNASLVKSRLKLIVEKTISALPDAGEAVVGSKHVAAFIDNRCRQARSQLTDG
jgi:serine/threonine-protein kinase HipA